MSSLDGARRPHGWHSLCSAGRRFGAPSVTLDAKNIDASLGVFRYAHGSSGALVEKCRYGLWTFPCGRNGWVM